MTPELHTDNIRLLSAAPSGRPPGWLLEYQTDHASRAHQLYVDGRLADWSYPGESRAFFLPEASRAARVTVVAVDVRFMRRDLSRLLPPQAATPTWTNRYLLARAAALRDGDEVAILAREEGSDPSADSVVDRRAAWPADRPRWAFGEDAFGRGAFGWGGSQAPGMGMAHFGAGPFGFDEAGVSLVADMQESGRYVLTPASLAVDGTTVRAAPQTVEVNPPPAPGCSLTVTDYDPQTRTITLSLS
jgi:hypothetical protein